MRGKNDVMKNGMMQERIKASKEGLGEEGKKALKEAGLLSVWDY